MPVDSRKQILKRIRERKYLNKDFDSLRADLLEYARTNFPDQIRDFSEASLGGLLLDLASYVGDVNSFYLDHQFQELSIDTAVESRNIERLIRAAGVPIVGASPAVVSVQFLIEVPATGNPQVPNPEALPIIRAGTTVRSNSGIIFELTENLDFRERNNNGDLIATTRVGSTNNSNNPVTFILTRTGICISGERATESLAVGNFTPFKRMVLNNPNVTEIVRVSDNLGNEYYEVDFLTQDTVFKATANTANDSVGRREIRGINNLRITFPESPSANISQSVRASIDATNEQEASGGENAPSIDDLKQRVPAVKASQGRIVSKEDLLARVYTMPSNFGRVFRASIQPDPRNPLAARLYIISRNNNEQLIVSPDSLKKNLQRFLNEYRLVSDAIEVLDARVINITINFSIVVDPNFNTNQVLQNVINRLRSFFGIRNFDIDQPIVLAEIQNIIFNNLGVLTVNSLQINNISGVVGQSNPRIYSDIQFDVETNTDRGIVVPPPGSIFELRFPDFDIVGSAT
jgi:hypothetical protein